MLAISRSLPLTPIRSDLAGEELTRTNFLKQMRFHDLVPLPSSSLNYLSEILGGRVRCLSSSETSSFIFENGEYINSDKLIEDIEKMIGELEDSSVQHTIHETGCLKYRFEVKKAFHCLVKLYKDSQKALVFSERTAQFMSKLSSVFFLLAKTINEVHSLGSGIIAGCVREIPPLPISTQDIIGSEQTARLMKHDILFGNKEHESARFKNQYDKEIEPIYVSYDHSSFATSHRLLNDKAVALVIDRSIAIMISHLKHVAPFFPPRDIYIVIESYLPKNIYYGWKELS